MKLNGKELRLIPGAIMVYLCVPLHHARRDGEVLSEDKVVLDKLDKRISIASEDAYRPHLKQGMSWAEMVEVYLKASLDFEFTHKEKQALARALDACAVELEVDPEADVNINFSGDGYGIRREDFVEMRKRLLGEV